MLRMIVSFFNERHQYRIALLIIAQTASSYSNDIVMRMSPLDNCYYNKKKYLMTMYYYIKSNKKIVNNHRESLNV